MSDPSVPEIALPGRDRGVFCNRTLNLRSIKAIGYDMDYTLIHYNERLWEERAYAHTVDALAAQGFPVEGLEFDPDFVTRGLILDLHLGNLVKANRFGYVKRAAHGTRMLDFGERKDAYAQVPVDLRDERWVFLNTLFSLSEACLYAQLVDKLDTQQLPGVLGYPDLYRIVKTCLDTAHMEGRLKSEIIADSDRFVVLDPDTPEALLDQKQAGKMLMLITNSGWLYSKAMMSYAFDRFLPGDMTWRDLFDLVTVSARKPIFFNPRAQSVFEVVNDAGMLQPYHGQLKTGGIYLGGGADRIEEWAEADGSEILYVGDHIYADVLVSKSMHRWRTAVIFRELERELAELERFEDFQLRLSELMEAKSALEFRYARLRLVLARAKAGNRGVDAALVGPVEAELDVVRTQIGAIDAEAGPLAVASSELSNERWGLLFRAGNDKSHLARQVERHADIYLSRVSNFLHYSPYHYFRSPRSSLPHDDLR